MLAHACIRARDISKRDVIFSPSTAARDERLAEDLRQLQSSSSERPLTPTTPNEPTLNTLLAHFRLTSARPPPETRWKGGRDVKSFLKKFKTVVEDLPGVTPDLVWDELSHRTTGLSLSLLDPFKDEEPEVAVKKAKERFL